MNACRCAGCVQSLSSITVDGLIARGLTVEASRLYARLAHPAGKKRLS